MDEAPTRPETLAHEPSPADGFTILEDGAHVAELARLATLDPIAYDQQRSTAAGQLGVRVSTLDDAVQALRPALDVAGGRGVCLPNVDPWPNPVSTGDLLDALVAAVRRHVILRPPAAVAVALWILHTWVADRFQHTPRLGITSPAKRCGKSTLLDVLRATCHRPLKADNISTSGVFRMVEALAPLTLLLDEADTFLGDNDELRGVLNSGFERSGEVIRVVEVSGEHQPIGFHTFAPLALAGIGVLPGTLEDRSVPIVLQRKGANETATKLREAGARDALAELARKAARWASDRGHALGQNPAIPEAMGDREGDITVPLLSIADDAGGRWPSDARGVVGPVWQAGGSGRQRRSRGAIAGGLARPVPGEGREPTDFGRYCRRARTDGGKALAGVEAWQANYRSPACRPSEAFPRQAGEHTHTRRRRGGEGLHQRQLRRCLGALPCRAKCTGSTLSHSSRGF